MKEEFITEFWNELRTRHATISKDKYHLIVRMNASQSEWSGSSREMQHYKTLLVGSKTLQYAENTAENFVQAYGEFKDLKLRPRVKVSSV